MTFTCLEGKRAVWESVYQPENIICSEPRPGLQFPSLPSRFPPIIQGTTEPQRKLTLCRNNTDCSGLGSKITGSAWNVLSPPGLFVYWGARRWEYIRLGGADDSAETGRKDWSLGSSQNSHCFDLQPESPRSVDLSTEPDFQQSKILALEEQHSCSL